MKVVPNIARKMSKLGIIFLISVLYFASVAVERKQLKVDLSLLMYKYVSKYLSLVLGNCFYYVVLLLSKVIILNRTKNT